MPETYVPLSRAALVTALALWPARANAIPTAPTALCAAEPEAAACIGTVPSCGFCHESTDPPSWNPFGLALKDAMAPDTPLDGQLAELLEELATQDADGDGIDNLTELLEGSLPGVPDAPTDDGSGSVDNPRYRVGQYDVEFAFRRVAALYCGRSPTYEEVRALHEGEPSEEALRERLHTKLSQCLDSAYWRKEGLQRLADDRIRPLQAAGPDSRIMIAGYRLVIGNYLHDYALWEWALTEDRDMREMLLADYYVVEDEQGSLSQEYDALPPSGDKALAGGQLVPQERRAGLLTTQWFLAKQTMFSDLPRTTAAQAYRAFLGADIAASEGLRPVEGEPVDVDDKGVDEPRCAQCHSTLDPLSYAFAEYNGIDVSQNLAFGAYSPGRSQQRMPAWNESKPTSMLLGQPVDDLLEWAQVAANSDEFKRNMALMFFEHALGHAPRPDELEEFNDLWSALPEDGYSANRLVHRFVDSLTFGRP